MLNIGRKIVGNVVGKVCARSYCSKSEVPSQIPSQAQAVLFLVSVTCASTACLMSISPGGRRIKIKRGGKRAKAKAAADKGV